MRWKQLLLLLLPGIGLFLLGFVKGKPGKSGFDNAREEIVMRQIAHRVLQYSGDSSSRVLSPERVNASEYRIPFETGFSFVPDSLVAIIGRVIRENQLPDHYIVNVMECDGDKVIFGFAILGSEQNNIVPCKGREQPVRKYCINIRFDDKKSSNQPVYLLAGGLLLLAGLIYYRRRTDKADVLPADTNEPESGPFIAIGRYRFHPDQQLLWLDGSNTVLTAKENKLLRIFAASPNEVIDRSRLQKEVWEDEGVIVGRSLDVFVSKLRKRLEGDERVKIATVVGKGYELTISG